MTTTTPYVRPLGVSVEPAAGFIHAHADSNGVPVPAGATEVDEWRLDGGTARGFTGTARVLAAPFGDDVRLVVRGEQDRDGRTDRHISINGSLFLYAAQARELAAHLLAAADELDALTAVTP